MKKMNSFYSILALLLLSSIDLNAWTFTWTGTNSSSWTDAGNWNKTGANTGVNTVPGSLDNVVISSSTGTQPILSANTSILNLNQSNGSLYLSDFTLTILNDANFTGGTVFRGTLSIANIAGMQNTTFDASGTTINIDKTGGSNNDLYGGNLFKGAAYIYNSSTSRFRLSVTSPDNYNGYIRYEERSTGALEPAYNGTNTYSSDMSSTNSTNTVSIGMGNGTAVINSATTLYGSKIEFNRLTINTSQLFRSLGALKINNLKIINGSVSASNNTWQVEKFEIVGGSFGEGTLEFKNIDSMYNGTFTNAAVLVKVNGGNSNVVYGGNVFNGTVTIRNNSDSLFRLANNIGDDYNGNTYFEEMSAGDLQPAYNGLNTFSGEIITNNSNYTIIFGDGSGWVVIDGNSSQSINGNGLTTPVVRRLRLNTTGSLRTLLPLTVSNQIDFVNGIIISSIFYDHFIILGDNATILTTPSNNSHVNGPFRKVGNDAFTFPVGNGTVYAPITISAPSNTTDHFTAQYFGTVFSATNVNSSLDHVSIKEYWTLDRTFGFSNVQVKLSFNSARSGGINNLSDLRVSRYNGSDWESTGNASVTGSNNSGTVEGNSVVSNFSPFTLGSTSTLNPLPVSLLSFKANKQIENVLVKWSTSNESNNDYFTVEKSYDGEVWINIGVLKGAVNSNGILNYELLDLNAKIGTQFYRLKQTDLNGKNSYSKIVSLNFSNENINLVKLYPQPVTGMLNINIPNNEDENASVTVYNTLGEKLFIYQNLSGLDFQIDLGKLINGIYYIELNVDGFISQSKIVKQ